MPVLAYIASLLGIDAKMVGPKPTVAAQADEAATEELANETATFSTFAELYDAAGPKMNSEKALGG